MLFGQNLHCLHIFIDRIELVHRFYFRNTVLFFKKLKYSLISTWSSDVCNLTDSARESAIVILLAFVLFRESSSSLFSSMFPLALANSWKIRTDILDPVSVIHLQFWAHGSWDSLFPILMGPTANLWVKNTIFLWQVCNTIASWDSLK